jgi:tripartite-type tricarboxylate transporter receptor subunit TctC
MAKILRRQFLHVVIGTAVLPALSQGAEAQAYPTRPVHWVVTTVPGGSGDITARLIGRWLSDHLGQPFIIDNRPGAGGGVATEIVVKEPADGYMLLIISTDVTVNEALYGRTEFSRNIVPVASISRSPLIMLVNPSVPAKTIPEFIDYARKNPSAINMASVGNGSPPHLAGELFKMMAGINMVHIPYRGGALALTDLLAGQVQVFFSNLPTKDYVTAGKLRALAVTTAERSPALPDVPAIAEYVPGYDASVLFGVGVRKGTPAEIIEKLNREISASLADPAVKAGIANLSGSPLVLSRESFANLMAEQGVKWEKFIRAANIKPD